MLLTEGKIVELDHRACLLRGATSLSIIVAASEDGNVSIVGPGFTTINRKKHNYKISDICPHPSRRLLALVDKAAGKLLIEDFDGSLLFEQKPSHSRRSTMVWAGTGFAACWFNEGGDHLWCAETLAEDKVEVQLLETDDWSVTCSIKVRDPYSESYCSFHQTGRPDTTALYLAAGQDGQQVYWVRKEMGDLRCYLEPHLENTTPPVFAPQGNEFLVLDDDQNIHKFEFPAIRQTGECRWPWDEDDGFGYLLCYLNAKLALVNSNEGRVFLLDVNRMIILEEIVIANPEPKPAEEVYPKLTGEKQLCTDLTYFERIGDMVIFVYRRDKGTDLKGWKDQLLIIPVSAFLGQFAY